MIRRRCLVFLPVAVACVWLSTVALHAGSRKVTASEREARSFLEITSGLVQPLQTVANSAAWVAATDVTPEHTAARASAEKALAAVLGSRLVIDRSQALLKQKAELDPLSVRQLTKLLLAAAESPATLPEVVSKRIEAEARQSSILDGYTFCLQSNPNGTCARPTSANDIDDLLRKSRNLKEREQAWLASKEIGRKLKPGLADLQTLRNQVARALGYSSFFALQVADY